jgi:hypothetical protein
LIHSGNYPDLVLGKGGEKPMADKAKETAKSEDQNGDLKNELIAAVENADTLNDMKQAVIKIINAQYPL